MSAKTTDGAYFMYVKLPGDKKSSLYAGEGRTTRLRIYACTYTFHDDKQWQDGQDWLRELRAQNPGLECAFRRISGKS